MIAPTLTFPCKPNKKPLTTHGFHDAKPDQSWEGWPLVGYPTGAINGFDVLDIDRRHSGDAWFDQNFDALPHTQSYESQSGGLHLLFKAAPGLRSSSDRIAPGVDVRAAGGYAIWWPREGLPVEGHPICEWPDWLLQEALGQGLKRNRHKKTMPSGEGARVAVKGVGVLCELDPCEWRDHDRWLKLMMSCHAAGIEREAFITWSTSDPQYANDGEVIGRRWDSLRRGGGVSAAILLTAVRRAKATPGGGKGSYVAVPSEAINKLQPTRNPLRRVDAIGRSVERARGNAREPALFAAACSMAEIIAEGRWKLAPTVARDLLEGYCRPNGLWKELGGEGCRRTIANGFRHVEEKLLATEERN